VTGVGEYSASRLRDYASAWRATGCGCGDCSQCAARDLTPKEADEIAECIDTLRRELHRIHASMSDWQPIETSPKDGTPILLLISGKAIQGHWMVDRWNPDGKWEVVWMDVHGCGCCSSDNEPPTRWMKLPSTEDEL